MKQTFTILLLLNMLLISCKKEGVVSTPLASLNIVNAVTGGTDVKLRGVPSYTFLNNGFSFLSVLPGKQDLYIYPVTDSLRPYYHGNNQVVMDAGQSYSLFLGGTPDAVSSLLVHETYTKQDNNIRVRFLNLSPGGPAINVTLASSPAVNEFLNIGYKQISEFKAFTKSGTDPTYNFEVRNAVTNEIIATFTLYPYIVTGFNKVTLVLGGILGGSPEPGLTFVLHN
ncbi:DUF4397 domain-containing protein [Pedobacter africanus]|uniref:DUF4397 domain-containing protein n=1 Tax=Pedobacter africanus TaxID=151894 RepID=A0A1W1Z716_9SPHI|nr:DUF4397 domain-containing protein [Pedobacter africanus]SMC44174.1 protein of unknown function [Pedobacter africanus]